MGRVITTNSATLVNKGLEVIEAHLLFDIPFDRIDVVVHPQQWIHSMVEFHDGSTIAQMGPPRMLVPIALGLSWPERLARHRRALRLDRRPQSWDFAPLDDEAFPAVRLARQVGEAGGTYPGRLQRGQRGRRSTPSTTARSASSTSSTRRPRRRGPRRRRLGERRRGPGRRRLGSRRSRPGGLHEAGIPQCLDRMPRGPAPRHTSRKSGVPTATAVRSKKFSSALARPS
jgi:hypothetical protein